jgi:hypothetical protein
MRGIFGADCSLGKSAPNAEAYTSNRTEASHGQGSGVVRNRREQSDRLLLNFGNHANDFGEEIGIGIGCRAANRRGFLDHPSRLRLMHRFREPRGDSCRRKMGALVRRRGLCVGLELRFGCRGIHAAATFSARLEIGVQRRGRRRVNEAARVHPWRGGVRCARPNPSKKTRDAIFTAEWTSNQHREKDLLGDVAFGPSNS